MAKMVSLALNLHGLSQVEDKQHIQAMEGNISVLA